MERAAAAGAGLLLNAEVHILARQMIGQPRAPRRASGVRGARRDCRKPRFRPGDVGVEILERKCQLIAIDALRLPSELMALKPLNDEAKSLDLGLRPSKLGLLTISLRSQVTHQLTQGDDVIRQCGEIEGHA